MEFADTLEHWLFMPHLWVMLAIVLVGADMVFGFQYFVLSVGVAALAVAGLLFARQGSWFGDAAPIETWRGVGFWFAVLSVVSVFAIRFLFQRRRGPPDINEY